jgi:hypothetical protein
MGLDSFDKALFGTKVFHASAKNRIYEMKI